MCYIEPISSYAVLYSSCRYGRAVLIFFSGLYGASRCARGFTHLREIWGTYLTV